MAPNVNVLNESERCAKLCSSQVLPITKTISRTEFRQEFATACLHIKTEWRKSLITENGELINLFHYLDF